MTALDKQARELAIKLGACTWQDGYEEPGKYVAEESAVVQILAFATQVREQTVAECKRVARHSETCNAFMETSGAFCDCGTHEDLDAIAAEQEER